MMGQADSPGYFAWTTTWGGDGSNYGVFVATSTASWGNGNAEHWESAMNQSSWRTLWALWFLRSP